MNDHRNHRYRESEPAWPTGDNAHSRGNRGEEVQERTGFWSPLWEDDDDEPARPPAGHSNGHSGRPRHGAASNGHSGGSHARRDDAPQWPGADGGDRSGGEHRWP
ncbi:MAG: hypothetical protein M3422_02165, partial [Actinomycetota bacterium]|nr:hypothetical protein [Actinomycetota bacterium]